MNVAITLVAIVIVVTGIYFSQRNKEESEVLSESEETVENQTTPSVKPTIKPTVTTAAPPPPQSISSLVSDYKYPNSQVVSSSNNFLQLSSTDNTDAITNWYKDKINSLGMNVTSFVTTQANDKVLNKLVGADGQKEIRVEISKENSSSLVQISVTI